MSTIPTPDPTPGVSDVALAAVGDSCADHFEPGDVGAILDATALPILATPHGHQLKPGRSWAAGRFNAGSMRLERQEVACEAAQPCRHRGGSGACPCDGDAQPLTTAGRTAGWST